MLYSQTNISVQFVFLAGFTLSAPWRTIECFFNCRDFFFFFFWLYQYFPRTGLANRQRWRHTNQQERNVLSCIVTPPMSPPQLYNSINVFCRADLSQFSADLFRNKLLKTNTHIRLDFFFLGPKG